jgi:hypothetical protein
MYSVPGDPMNVGKDYIFRGSPSESLDSLTSCLIDKGYGIKTRTENKVSMCRHSITPDWVLAIFIVSLFTYGTALLSLLALYFIKRRVTVVASPLRGGTSLVTVTCSSGYAERALEAWINVKWANKARPWRPGASRWSYFPDWSTRQERTAARRTPPDLGLAPLTWPGVDSGKGKFHSPSPR